MKEFKKISLKTIQNTLCTSENVSNYGGKWGWEMYKPTIS